ncbi:MAG: Plasmid stabilization system [uncultured bacterium (gcode 4)]|uniref:Plasmid stabilization system n=1 Tax=uncultured bacterium (gcode 4) TaxID=1234023 RepID=K1YP76_9BACT|nr:MAG: Plasmid stabilization system [uncultured bacterium (gcode 4)]
MQVRYHRQFEKDLEKCNFPELIQDVFVFIEALEHTSSLQNIRNIKKLSGFSSFYRYRIGEYRLGFRLTDTHVQLDRFLHRKDIYKKYP